jgi:hypothetical protein
MAKLQHTTQCRYALLRTAADMLQPGSVLQPCSTHLELSIPALSTRRQPKEAGQGGVSLLPGAAVLPAAASLSHLDVQRLDAGLMLGHSSYNSDASMR